VCLRLDARADFIAQFTDRIPGDVCDLGIRSDGRRTSHPEITKQSAKQALDQVRQEGWKGMKGKMIEYTRNEPINALLIALGTGLLLGLLTKRARG
jgi:ElaB/YqjD/DUF883 family membrane-anchored ribosome-binding protein